MEDYESSYSDQLLQAFLQTNEGKLVLDASNDEVDALLAREDYGYYCTYTHNFTYHRSRHTDYICNKLEAVERGDIKKIMFLLPPRHSKSRTVSETFPSWFIGKNPNRRVMIVSYGEDLARGFGKCNRDKIEEFGELIFNIRTERGNSSVTHWGVERDNGDSRYVKCDGYIRSVGIMGGIAGKGADLLLFDDLIKNREEADSPAYKKKLWREYNNTLLSRLSPNARIIGIQTRWAEDDLPGQILELEEDEWEVVKLPALAEENDLLGRKIGEALWPEFGYDEEWLEGRKVKFLKNEDSSRAWNSLYQQNPSLKEGNLINRGWWRYYSVIPSDLDRMVQSWDMSFKNKEESDNSYVVGQVWGARGTDRFLLDEIRRKMGFVETKKAFRQLTEKWPLAGKKYIEDKANGAAIEDELKREIGGIELVNPQGSKYARMEAVSGQIQIGCVYLPDPRIYPWVSEYIDELAWFPDKPNDRGDATSQALFKLRRIGRGIRMV